MANVLPAGAITRGDVSPQHVGGQSPRLGDLGFPRGDQPRKAVRWREAAKTRRATILIQGDSLTGGTGATGLNGYAQQLRTAILAEGYTDGGAGFIFTTDSRVTRSGFGSVLPTLSNWTRGGSPGDTAAITQDMSELWVMYQDQSVAHGIEVSIDGGAYTTVSQPGKVADGSRRLAQITGFSPGSHTVTIRINGTGFHLDGFIVYATASTTPSVAVSIVSLGGMAGTIDPRSYAANYVAHLRLIAADAAIFTYGTNDSGSTYGTAYQPEWTTFGLAAYATAARESGAEVILVSPVRPSPLVRYPWPMRAASIRQAARDTNSIFVDTDPGENGTPGVLSDTLHPNNTGYLQMFNAIYPLVCV